MTPTKVPATRMAATWTVVRPLGARITNTVSMTQNALCVPSAWNPYIATPEGERPAHAVLGMGVEGADGRDHGRQERRRLRVRAYGGSAEELLDAGAQRDEARGR